MAPNLQQQRSRRRFLTFAGLSAAGLMLPNLARSAPLASVAYRPDLGTASPLLDIYERPSDQPTARAAPVMIYVHGGAWRLGSRAQVHEKPAYFKAAGFVFISLDYRLFPGGSVAQQLEDIDHAMSWIAANIARYCGDPQNLHLLGHSAGAHLVAMTGVRPLNHTAPLVKSGALRSIIANDTRAYDLSEIARLAPGGQLPKLYSRVFDTDPAHWATLSPLLQINAPTPPFLLLHSGQGLPNARADITRKFAGALRRNGTDVEFFDGTAYSHREMNGLIGAKNPITQALSRFLLPLSK